MLGHLFKNIIADVYHYLFLNLFLIHLKKMRVLLWKFGNPLLFFCFFLLMFEIKKGYEFKKNNWLIDNMRKLVFDALM